MIITEMTTQGNYNKTAIEQNAIIVVSVFVTKFRRNIYNPNICWGVTVPDG